MRHKVQTRHSVNKTYRANKTRDQDIWTHDVNNTLSAKITHGTNKMLGVNNTCL